MSQEGHPFPPGRDAADTTVLLDYLCEQLAIRVVSLPEMPMPPLEMTDYSENQELCLNITSPSSARAQSGRRCCAFWPSAISPPARCASWPAASGRMTVDGRAYDVRATTPEAFDGVDIALFAGTEGEKGAAVTFGPEAVRRGAVVIDNGADFRMRPDVPLVVPEVNAAALKTHEGIIANPNCSTAQLVLALKPLHDAARITRVLVATYQAVSGAGGAAVDELKAQNGALAEGRAITSPARPSRSRSPANVIPQIGGFDDAGYTSEEMKLVHETHKIMGDDTIRVTPIVAARVPVFVGHSEAVYVETERPADARTTPAPSGTTAPGLAVLDERGGGRPVPRVPDAAVRGRQGHDLCGPHPAGPGQPERPELLGRQRQPAQRRGDQRRADRRKLWSSRTC